MKRLAALLAGLGIALSANGCGRGGPEIVPIEGTVTHNGQPVPNVRLYFFPTEGRFSWAITDQNGRFALDYDPDHRGAKVGPHTVVVLDEGGNVDPTAAMSGPVTRPKRTAELAKVLEKYSSKETSSLKVEVKKADKNFQLKLD